MEFFNCVMVLASVIIGQFHAFVAILFIGQLILLAFRSYHIMQ